MIVCICHNLSTKRIVEVLKDNDNQVAKVHKDCDCQVRCGKCLDYIKHISSQIEQGVEDPC